MGRRKKTQSPVTESTAIPEPQVRRGGRVKVAVPQRQVQSLESMPQELKTEFFGKGGTDALAAAVGVKDNEYLAVQTTNKVFSYFDEYLQPAKNRDEMYKNVEDMGYDPTISSALSLYADDAFGDMTQGTDRSIWCTSSNSRLQDIIDDFLYNSGIIERIWSVTYNTCKYGDMFVHVDGEFGHGIVNLDFDIHPKLLKRYEKNGKLFAFASSALSHDKQMTYFAPFQFVHFRHGVSQLKKDLQIGRIKEGTYGEPLFNNIISTWRKLNLMEDTMVMYRNMKVNRPHLIKIDMTGIPKAKQAEYFNKIVNRFEYSSSYSQAQGIYQEQAKAMAGCEPIYIAVTPTTGNITHEDWSEEPKAASLIDMEWMKKKMFGGLKIPPAYLGETDTLPSGIGDNSLYMISMRYARTVRAVRNEIMAAVKRICMIHLAYRDKKLMKYDFDLNTASVTTAEDLMTAETSKTVISFLTDFARMLGEVDVDYDRYKFGRWAVKHLNLNDFDINEILKKVETNLEKGGAESPSPTSAMASPKAPSLVTEPKAPNLTGKEEPEMPEGMPEMGAGEVGGAEGGELPAGGFEKGGFVTPGRVTAITASAEKGQEGSVKLEDGRSNSMERNNRNSSIFSFFQENLVQANKDLKAALPEFTEKGRQKRYDFRDIKNFVRKSSTEGKSKKSDK